jgi:multimeric flavodoxin WrbA
MVEADGIILASPVYYGGIAGGMKCFLDRAFLAAGNKLHHKVGAALVTLRRSGGLETYQQLNAYLNTMEMVIATSDYWQAAHGLNPGEVLQDTEGVEVMAKLGRNIGWLVRLIENGKGTIDAPETNPRTMTNFVR